MTQPTHPERGGRPGTSNPPRRPVIGLTPDVASAEEEAAGAPRYELKLQYVEGILKAGGLPLLLPFSEDSSVVRAYLERVQGLVVTGGAFDIPPGYYNETPREGLGPLKPERTAFETLALRLALERELPILGICGGMQLLNVHFGGTLHQDISRELPEALVHEQKHESTQPQHPVEVKDGTHLSDAVGKGALMVNSTHHQAVNALGEGLRVSAVAPDGVIEAIESTKHPFVLGVQWHPEALVGSVPVHLGILKHFIRQARDVRS
jgi:putative glutamine amidotransferase